MALLVYASGMLAGKLDMAAGEPFYGFTYDSSYLARPDAAVLSLSLPLRAERFDGAQSLPFFEGLLPEGDVREAIARQLHISSRSPMRLLQALGKDCAGDIAVLEEDDPFQPPSSEAYMPLDGGLARIAQNPHGEIARLRAGNRLSLAGGMEKIGLYHDERCDARSGWYVPLEGSPSTHIVKPQLLESYPLLAYNELLSMRLAREVGLATADAFVVEYERPLLVVVRFDRERTGATTKEGYAVYRRLRQEDACQALGFHSGMKYEQEGGPSVAMIGDLLLRNSADYLADRDQLARLVVFNYLIGNCDAHAKNYSLRLGRGASVRLAPAYDLVSTTVYDGIFGGDLSRQMGMRIGGHGNIDRVDRDDLMLMGAALHLSHKQTATLVDDMCTRVTECFEEVVGVLADECSADATELVERFWAGVLERINRLAG